MDYISDIRITRGAMWSPTGFMVRREPTNDDYGHCVLRFENLNPQAEFNRVVSRWDLVRLAVWALMQAVRQR